MRKAFIGLSTPIAYDYNNIATKTAADTYSSPNPIIDSPFGLLLLFDELVFLTRSLCPENMRGLEYVSFLDESVYLPAISKEEIEVVTDQAWNHEIQSNIEEIALFECIPDVVKEFARIDNHTHNLKIGELLVSGNANARNLAIDALICSKLSDPSLEMISNTRFQKVGNLQHENASMLKLAEIITIDGIPNYITKSGPYHECIEEVRQSKYLKDFRRWISNKPKNISASEISGIKDEVERSLKEAQAKVFLKHLGNEKHYKSIGKAILGDALGLLCPVTGTISAIAEASIGVSQEKNQYWQGFIIEARTKIKY